MKPDVAYTPAMWILKSFVTRVCFCMAFSGHHEGNRAEDKLHSTLLTSCTVGTGIQTGTAMLATGGRCGGSMAVCMALSYISACKVGHICCLSLWHKH